MHTDATESSLPPSYIEALALFFDDDIDLDAFAIELELPAGLDPDGSETFWAWVLAEALASMLEAEEPTDPEPVDLCPDNPGCGFMEAG
jgi:hypothetical protein